MARLQGELPISSRLAATEELGAADVAAAAARVDDPELAAHLERRAAVAARHATLLRAGTGAPGAAPLDLSGGRLGTGVDARGFPTPAMLDALGEPAYVATLHVADERARRTYASLPGALDTAVADAIDADLAAQVATSGAWLDRFRQRGRGVEVDAALRDARRARWWAAWLRLGSHSGAGFAGFMFRVLYWTALVPVGMVTRRGRARPAVHDAPAGSGMTSQY